MKEARFKILYIFSFHLFKTYMRKHYFHVKGIYWHAFGRVSWGDSTCMWGHTHTHIDMHTHAHTYIHRHTCTHVPSTREAPTSHMEIGT